MKRCRTSGAGIFCKATIWGECGGAGLKLSFEHCVAIILPVCILPVCGRTGQAKFPTAPVETTVSTLGTAEALYLSRTCPQSWSSDGIPEGRVCFTEGQRLVCKANPPHLAYANCTALRRWFLKKRPVINPGVGPLGTTGRLSFLKPRHLFGSHTKTLRPIVSQTASEASPVLCLKEPFKHRAKTPK